MEPISQLTRQGTRPRARRIILNMYASHEVNCEKLKLYANPNLAGPSRGTLTLTAAVCIELFNVVAGRIYIPLCYPYAYQCVA